MLDRLVLPEQVVIRLVTGGAAPRHPANLSGVVVSIDILHCTKNPYHLGPFFTDEDGAVVISRSQLLLSAAAELASGLMDYGKLEDCSPAIEVRVWSADDVRRALTARQHTWTAELPRESDLYGSLEALVGKYAAAPNSRLRARARLRDQWTEARMIKEYEVVVALAD